MPMLAMACAMIFPARNLMLALAVTAVKALDRRRQDSCRAKKSRVRDQASSAASGS
jgi:hypothetical protein